MPGIGGTGSSTVSFVKRTTFGQLVRNYTSAPIVLAFVFLLLLLWLVVYPFLQLIHRTVIFTERDRRIAQGI